jgi:GMP synthase-like glutamine amidotransferase
LPEKFAAQMGRKDRAAKLPPGVLHLAASELNPNQALRIPGQPIWTTQFHPELDEETNRGRFLRYMSGYAAHMTPKEQRKALDNRFGPSPDTDKLLPAFLELVFG